MQSTSTITPSEIMKERYQHIDLASKLANLAPVYKRKLLAEIPKPADNHDYMCHTYSASYALQWLYANHSISAKPFPVRSREAKAEVNSKTSNYTTLPKNKNNSFLSLRSISKSMSISNVGELLNGDELCKLINSCKIFDPNQNYTAESQQFFNKNEYINAIIAAIDDNTPPIVVFDSKNPIGFRKGQQEHATLVLGYIQSTKSSEEIYFILTGNSGYWLTTAATLFASTSQLEPRYYNKSLFQFEGDPQKISIDEKKNHENILTKYSNVDSLKVNSNGIKSWRPVTKMSSHLKEIHNSKEILDGTLPENCQKKIAFRQSNKGWNNTIVIIKPIKKEQALNSEVKQKSNRLCN